MQEKRGFTEKEASQYIGMSRSFLRIDRMEGPKRGPKFIRIGRTIRYLKEELDAWLEQHISKPD